MTDTPVKKVDSQLCNHSYDLWQEYASVTNAPPSIALERLVLAGCRALYAEYPNLATKREALRKDKVNRERGSAVFAANALTPRRMK